MEFNTITEWDDAIWESVKRIYYQSFHAGKPENIIRNMFRKKICTLHTVIINNDVIGMSLTGRLCNTNYLIIDYFAVDDIYRGKGVGSQLLEYIIDFYKKEINLFVIEVECEKTTENLRRIQFWKRNGFKLTDYKHQYIWVPEPYQAMYLSLSSEIEYSNGELLFQWISSFHKVSYQSKN